MDELLHKMEKYAQRHNVPIMQGEGVYFLKQYIEDNNISRILEVGSAIGYSAIQMALVSPSVEVVSIERDELRYNEAIKNVQDAGLKDRITLYHADALEIEIDGLFDMIFIDAAKAQYIRFFTKYEKNLQVGGSIISDNLSFHGMVEDIESVKNRNTKQLVKKIIKYIKYLQNHEEYHTTFYDIGDGIAISKKK